MDMPTAEELILTERKFLHDLANDIVVAHGMTSIAHRNLFEKKVSDDTKTLDKLVRAIEAINRMTEQLKARRTYLRDITLHEP